MIHVFEEFLSSKTNCNDFLLEAPTVWSTIPSPTGQKLCRCVLLSLWRYSYYLHTCSNCKNAQIIGVVQYATRYNAIFQLSLVGPPIMERFLQRLSKVLHDFNRELNGPTGLHWKTLWRNLYTSAVRASHSSTESHVNNATSKPQLRMIALGRGPTPSPNLSGA